jgi:hypothetical protein
MSAVDQLGADGAGILDVHRQAERRPIQVTFAGGGGAFAWLAGRADRRSIRSRSVASTEYRLSDSTSGQR